MKKNFLLHYLVYLFVIFFCLEMNAQWHHTMPYRSTFTDIQFIDYQNGFAVGRDNGIGSCGPSLSAMFRTMDGGETWVRNALSDSREFTSVYFLRPDLGWASSYYGGTYRSTDCGATWTLYPSGIPQTVNDIYFIDQNIGFAVAGEGHIRKSTNGGLSWSFNFDAGSQTLNKVHFVNANLGFSGQLWCIAQDHQWRKYMD